jgi:hypothetical protein
MPLTLVDGKVRYSCPEHGISVPGWCVQKKRQPSPYCKICARIGVRVYNVAKDYNNRRVKHYWANPEKMRQKARERYWRDPSRARERNRLSRRRRELTNFMPEPAKNKSVLALNI